MKLLVTGGAGFIGSHLTDRLINDGQLAKIIGGRVIHLPLRLGEAKATLADITKALKILGWEPKISLKQGLKMIQL